MMQPMTIIAAILAVLSIIFLVSGLSTLRKRRYSKGIEYFLLAFVMIALSGLFAAATFALKGYRAFTYEETAAVVEVIPVGERRFSAQVRFSDGGLEVYHLHGDEIYIDARILKWKPIFNMLGLHTAYQLDRIGGRYRDIEEERKGDRTIYRLAPDRPLDMFELARRYEFLSPILDAEYGSATFTAADRPSTFEIRVSKRDCLSGGWAEVDVDQTAAGRDGVAECRHSGVPVSGAMNESPAPWPNPMIGISAGSAIFMLHFFSVVVRNIASFSTSAYLPVSHISLSCLRHCVPLRKLPL